MGVLIAVLMLLVASAKAEVTYTYTYVIGYDNHDTRYHTVYCYIWDDDDNKYAGGWHGSAMRYDDDEGLWVYTLHTNTPARDLRVIFNDNGDRQTGDLYLSDYVISTSKNRGGRSDRKERRKSKQRD